MTNLQYDWETSTMGMVNAATARQLLREKKDEKMSHDNDYMKRQLANAVNAGEDTFFVYASEIKSTFPALKKYLEALDYKVDAPSGSYRDQDNPFLTVKF